MARSDLLLAAVIPVLATSTVNAQPLATPPGEPSPLPPPQTDEWSNVSHINGQVVKVGERQDYLKEIEKKTMIAVNPIGVLFGFYSVSLSHAISDNLAVRGNFSEVRIDDIADGREIGGSVVIYLRRVFQGPFLEPGVMYRTEDGATAVGPSVVFGWQWTYDSGLSVAMAAGAMRNLEANDDGPIADDKVQPSAYFRVGYAF